MFDSLTSRLSTTFSGLKNRDRLSEEEINRVTREIRIALLEADVALPIVKEFISKVKEQVNETELAKHLDPSQQVIKVVNEQLVEILGGETRTVRYATDRPTVIMLSGLQGVGKTTFAGKLALKLRSEGKNPLLVAADLLRPNAVNQLKVNGERVNTPVYAPFEGNGNGDPVEVAQGALTYAAEHGHDVVIVDTAGRLGVDTEMMEQARAIQETFNPDETLFVLDSMMGQNAVETATAFQDVLNYDGVVLTKLDGDTRGGAALSIRSATGKPIMFASVGEGMEDLEVFHPDRMASRILDMGDVLTLIEEADKKLDKELTDAAADKLSKGTFHLGDFNEQLNQLKKIGSMGKIAGFLPGMGQFKEQIANIDEREIARQQAIILSMTQEERVNPKVIDKSRRRRIANGSGVTEKAVTNLIERFEEAKVLMERMSKPGVKPNFGKMTAEVQAKHSSNQKKQQKKGKGARRSGNPAKR